MTAAPEVNASAVLSLSYGQAGSAWINRHFGGGSCLAAADESADSAGFDMSCSQSRQSHATRCNLGRGIELVADECLMLGSHSLQHQQLSKFALNFGQTTVDHR